MVGFLARYVRGVCIFVCSEYLIGCGGTPGGRRKLHPEAGPRVSHDMDKFFSLHAGGQIVWLGTNCAVPALLSFNISAPQV